MKEHEGGDNLAVRWLMPDGTDQAPIPAEYLLPYGTSFAAPVIAQNPANTTAMEGGIAPFKVTLTTIRHLLVPMAAERDELFPARLDRS